MARRVPSKVGGFLALLTRSADFVVVLLVVVSVGMMIIPLPTLALDLLISLNLAGAVTLLLVAIYVGDALNIATFPTLLLLTTLFRLAIEVSATRLILLKANAGQVIAAFGGFVVSGNLVVGIVVFAILTVIQYVVIAKGAARVAEVGARFTLDAMPGKQMAIDAELRAGYLDHAQATQRRATLARESQFFGSMDGAMKFVKGDAVAGIVVLLVNIAGGLLIGVLQKGMSLPSALRTYTLLTVGEGLVAQIPALVIATAAGILVTRVSSEEAGSHLGRDIGKQILAQPKALAITAGLLAALAVVPGLPAVPFCALAALLGFVAYRRLGAGRTAERDEQDRARGLPDRPLLAAVEVELGSALAGDLRPGRGPSRLESEWLPAVRERFFAETGIALPTLSVRGPVVGLAGNAYRLCLQEIPVASGTLPPGQALALGPLETLAPAGIVGLAGAHPDGTPGVWIAEDQGERARALGLDVLAPGEVIAAHLYQALRRHGYRLVGIEETQKLLDSLARTHPALVREVVPQAVTPVLLAEVLQRLAREGISLRYLGEILPALARRPAGQDDAGALVERVRAALQRQITFQHTAADGNVGVYFVDADLEETVREAIREGEGGCHLALEPELAQDIVSAVARAVAGAARPAILTSADLRPHLRALLEPEHPEVAVLAYPELAPEAKLEALGHITIGTAETPA